MPVLQFAGQSYQARSTQLIAQQCINAFVETTPKDAKTPVPVFGTPGLSIFARAGNGPINGMWIMAGNLYFVSGGALYEVLASNVTENTDGSFSASSAATLLGQTGLGGILSMADNGQQLVMVDGFGGWIYQPGGLNQVTTATAGAGATSVAANQTGTLTAGDPITITLDTGQAFPTTIATTSLPASGMIFWSDPLPSQASAGAIIIDPSVTLARITAVAFMPANVVTYMDGYFVFNAAGTRQFFLSGINDGTQYSGLDFATATANTGFVLAVVNFHEQLLIFTSKASTEVWYDSGASAFPFQRYDGAYLQRGIAAPLAQCSEDNTVLWMGDDGIAYRLNGFLPQRISTFAMEHAWAQYPLRYLDCIMFVLDQEGHKFVVFQFPSGCGCWVYDISTQLWHQRQSVGAPFV